MAPRSSRRGKTATNIYGLVYKDYKGMLTTRTSDAETVAARFNKMWSTSGRGKQKRRTGGGF